MDIPDPATIQLALDELETLSIGVGKLLTMARECNFPQLIETLCADVRRDIIPGVMVLLCITNGKQRKAASKVYRRLQKMISTKEETA